MEEESPIKTLMHTWKQAGTVKWIGIRPARRAPLESLDAVEAITSKGLAGDRSVQRKKDSKRQVTLIQAEHLDAVAHMLGVAAIDPGDVRRNIVVEGINLLSLKGQQIQIGSAILEITGPCHPCSRMEENLGKGGYNAMRGHGGWCTKVVQGGTIALGDEIKSSKWSG